MLLLSQKNALEGRMADTDTVCIEQNISVKLYLGAT